MAFIKFTLGDIRTSVKRKLDDTAFDDATIDEAANDFQFELFNDNRIRFMEANDTLTVLEDEVESALPADFMNLINLIVLDDASTYRNITKNGYLNYNDFMELHPGFSVATASKILEWTFFGEGVRFQSPTDAGYTINIDYTRSPVLMVDADDECELPINARELMTLGALNRIMRVNEDYSEASQEFQYLQQLKASFVKNYGRGGERVGPQTIRTGRGGVGGYRVDRDF